MTFLDVFALFVLFVLAAAVVGIWVMLGMMPGKIAHKRNHPQSEAINVCGWWGGYYPGYSVAPGLYMGLHEPAGAPAHR